MLFKIIVTIYCLVGLAYNILLILMGIGYLKMIISILPFLPIPKKNKLIEEQNQFILGRYERLDKLMDKIENILDSE